ncbi:MAG TPA: N(4)-(beta-N-acetylglucosaminyl)-L-asparaginase [Bacteroidia bacterium]|nr:N(4)-(beta-N-acetylglucosaminyl)-L-asparaginase [Bacteroidia bacterium]
MNPINRKTFLRTTALATLFAGFSSKLRAEEEPKVVKINPHSTRGLPIVISTWSHGMPANEAAVKVLKDGGNALDAAERGVWVIEADKNNTSVGLGGFPDRDGIVTLDASIMQGGGEAGSVAFVQGIEHPISLARAVMEKTPHVLMVGRGAELFAESLGIKQLPNTRTEQTDKAWKEWLKEKNYKPIINIENHDTIGLLCMDQDGAMAGVCTTSGLAWKMHGRVGDSPIIGAGLFVDGDVGAATCTGLGETVLRTLASHVAVEEMRRGATPQDACEEAIRRIVKKHANFRDFQVGILAISKTGEHGAYGLQKGFNYALYQHEKNVLLDADSYLK